MTFSFFKEDKLKFAKLILPTSELTKYMQSCFKLPLLDDVTLYDMNMKLSESTKFELTYTFTLGHFSDLNFLKKALIELSNDQYPHDIIGEICSFFCVDDYLYKFKFIHSYKCSVVQNLYGSEFSHQNDYQLDCLSDPKFYSLQYSWSDEHFRALLLSMVCCGYKIIKKSSVLNETSKTRQSYYIDGPMCQNMELFTKTVHKSGGINFDELLKGLTLSEIDGPILKGLDAAIKKSKSQKDANGLRDRSIVKRICEFLHQSLNL